LPELRFAGVRKDYGPVQALRGFDLAVADGELLVLVGPSGSGKSTALRAAAGLEDVTDGSIHIGARDVTRVPAAQRNVSMVFQSYALFPHLTVAENIGFGLRARGVARDESRRRVAHASETVGCEKLLDRKPFELSGGERQRVALARALVREPDVYLLDEPLSNLDAQLRVQVRSELKLLHQGVGTTTVHVTHDQVEALTMGDRVAVLRDGIIEQLGSPTEVYRRPANRFVAGFIGSPAMNFLRGTVDDGAIRIGAVAIPHRVERLPGGRQVEVGIRPEHVELADDGLPAEVALVEMAGSETFVRLTADGAPLVARVPPGQSVAPGSNVRVRIPPDRVHLFDAQTGERLG